MEQRLADLERHSTQLIESVLDTLRSQSEEVANNRLEEFRQQLEVMIQDAQGRLRQGLQQAYEESATSLFRLRTELLEQLASRGTQMTRATEETLRTRLRSQLGGLEQALSPTSPKQGTEK
jgi:F0F1-type ATP synthase membrane subunit b/b'